MADIGGWNVTGSSGAGGAPATAHKAGQANKQHVIYSISGNFSAAPSAPVLVAITQPDVSPNTVLWSGYLPVSNDFQRTFPAGLVVPLSQGVDVILAGNGSLTGKISMHGTTR